MARKITTSLLPWITCLSSALFFFFVFMQVNMFNAISLDLIQTFHLRAIELGHLSAFYFYGTVLFLFPAGMLLDRFSTRRIILIAMSITLFCTLGFALATSVWQADLARFIIGICGAFCLLSSVKLASRWFPPQRMALIVGLIVTLAMLGGMCAQTPLTLLTDAVGWRKALIYDAGLGLILLAAIILWVKDYPAGQEHHQDLEKNHLKELGFWTAMGFTVRNWQNLLAGLYASLINLPIFLLGATWGSLYLVQMHHLSRAQSSLIISMIFIGLIVGCPAIGWLSDFIQRRKMPMIVGAVCSLIFILLIMYAPNLNFVELLSLFLGLGLAISSQVIAYPLVAESNPRTLTGTSEGLASVLIMSGGFVIPLFPYLLELNWNHQTLNHVPIFSAVDYHLALMIMPLAFVIALLASFLVRETNCRACTEEITMKKISSQEVQA